MPILLVFAYLIAETLTFWAISTWLGFWWTFLTMFALMTTGTFLATLQLRHTRSIGNLGLLMLAIPLNATPGYLTSALGLLLVFPPTRTLARRVAARRLTATLEEFGTRLYENSPMSAMRTTYGTFTDSGTTASREVAEVIDEAEIREWSDNLSPEDFKKDQR